MRFLTHPAMIPLYAYTFIIELERQSYSINFSYMLMIILYAAAMLWLCDFFVNKLCRKYNVVNRPLTHFLTPATPRVLVAALFTIIFTCITITTLNMEHIYTWGAKYIFAIFILPTWLNVLSGQGIAKAIPRARDTFLAKMCLAPCAYIGSLSALVIAVGYRTSTDTFWPFVITLLLFAIEAYHTIRETEAEISGPIYCYVIGIAQAVITMFIFA